MAMPPGSEKQKLPSPIQNLEGPLAATVAQRTTLVVKGDEFCLILSRVPAPRPSVLLPKKKKAHAACSTTKQRREVFGVPVVGAADTAAASTTTKSSSPWYTSLTRSCVCCTTGFAADVGHLMGRLQKYIAHEESIQSRDYYHTSTSSLSPLTVAMMTRYLALLMRSSTLGDQGLGRPFGVQVMMVGWDGTEPDGSPDGWQVYTVDPTGSWRHVRTSVGVIGRCGRAIEQILRQDGTSQSNNTESSSLMNSIDRAINATLVGLSNQPGAVHLTSECFEGVLLWRKDAQCYHSLIDSDFLRERYLDQLQMVSN